MKTYASLLENIVTNIIVAPSLEIAEQVTSQRCVDCTGLSINIGYTYGDGVFSAPVEETPSEETPA
jgi:hypothetical protein